MSRHNPTFYVIAVAHHPEAADDPIPWAWSVWEVTPGNGVGAGWSGNAREAREHAETWLRDEWVNGEHDYEIIGRGPSPVDV